MAVDVAQTCPLCAAVDDPAGMLGVEIERVFPPASVMTLICRNCAVAITARWLAQDEAAPIQGVKDESIRAGNSGATAPASDSDSAAGPVVFPNQPGDEATGLNRPESQAASSRESKPRGDE
jgi:hypothetical protein